MIIAILICDQCRAPIGNRMAIPIDGKWVCSLRCGIEMFGREKYLFHWEREAWERLQKINKYRNMTHFRTIIESAHT